MKESLLLIGAGGHAHSCIDVIELEDKYQIVGFVDQKSKNGESILGYPVLGSDDDLAMLFQKYKNAFICVGQIKNFEIRFNLYSKLKSIGFKLPAIVSPKAYVSRSASIGEGSIVMHQAMVNQNAVIGMNSIINSGTIIEHDVKVGNHSHVSTGCVLNGGVTIGDFTFVGSGTIVRESVEIGSKVIIGMQSKVFKDLENGMIYK
ncbi:acetyltransferase [Leptospira jelokensis]|uniref:acetyltransferase n=1 Tax=Leptospira jelokensis TaxID=2484931 RepID=UPI0010915376|nr:acetyltransferase [Leptospira jelokensis]TGL99203.1 acetyltransferase [Leptospira jelokensis]